MIAANDLKLRGVKAIEEELQNFDEVGITVRGKVKYVIMKVEKFDELREYELTHALAEAQKDIEEGRYVIETAEQHINRLWND
ncbi:MAG TPA: prevent-host-death protein [Runella sp.]|nr:prevent-host-death protein [Runella sp.]